MNNLIHSLHIRHEQSNLAPQYYIWWNRACLTSKCWFLIKAKTKISTSVSLCDTRAASIVAGLGLQHNDKLMKCTGPSSSVYVMVSSTVPVFTSYFTLPAFNPVWLGTTTLPSPVLVSPPLRFNHYAAKTAKLLTVRTCLRWNFIYNAHSFNSNNQSKLALHNLNNI